MVELKSEARCTLVGGNRGAAIGRPPSRDFPKTDYGLTGTLKVTAPQWTPHVGLSLLPTA